MNLNQSAAIDEIVRAFNEKGQARYAREEVTQREHALQSAALALKEQVATPLVCAALLHDLGHMLGDTQMPGQLEDDLHDRHEEKAFQFLSHHFGSAVAEPVRLHVAAKRYLCTIDPAYEKQLSPTSLKSFHDQGGKMTHEELRAFEQNPYYPDALRLRRWDDIAKEPGREAPSLENYLPLLKACLTGLNTVE